LGLPLTNFSQITKILIQQAVVYKTGHTILYYKVVQTATSKNFTPWLSAVITDTLLEGRGLTTGTHFKEIYESSFYLLRFWVIYKPVEMYPLFDVPNTSTHYNKNQPIEQKLFSKSSYILKELGAPPCTFTQRYNIQYKDMLTSKIQGYNHNCFGN
jgi:hypothetical protein